MRSIQGSGATPENLQRLDAAYALLPRDSFRDLDIVMQPTDTNGSLTGGSGMGLWMPFDAQGESMDKAPRGSTATSGRITYMSSTYPDWLLVHEVGHHIELFLDAPFGRKLLEQLGYRVKQQGDGNDPVTYANTTEFDGSSVADASYPTRYARTRGQEHIAELFADYFLPGQEPPEDPVASTYALDPAVRATFAAKLGQRGGQI